jgi:lipopolysaccharide/colanic/teichoic acid biosynthesis glycosyltransferase/acyl carrier protein
VKSAGWYARWLKRPADVVLAAVLLIVLVPLMAAVAAAVWIVLGWPVLFVDRRAGRDGHPIGVPKFRSMTNAVDAAGQPLSDADRLGRFGRLLRRLSLDELPQLVSVVRGDMSLIGPRPLPLRYVGRYSPRQARRLDVRPGMSGLAQVQGRNALGWPERLELDVRYVEMQGKWWAALLDLWILGATLRQIVVQSVSGQGMAAPHQATMHEFASDSDTVIAAEIDTAIRTVLRDTGREADALGAESLLQADIGLDSLDLAQTVVLLERALGIDPFRNAPAVPAVRTIADLRALYSQSSPARLPRKDAS